ncbi:MAG: hypothetical protein CMG62_08880 [Candidatus Marinimicrobia bacterium]|nr:hypothetical protein [Candidatus Neomarinimicrobiota bacterium]|tara:strand:+ start:8071 stop:8478 length:408 start_codon:yes stop_codon:yes gene_type:complete
MKWFIKCFREYANFKGRASRSELWYFLLFWLIFYFIIIIIDRKIGYSFLKLSDLPFNQYLPIAKFYSDVGVLVFLYRPLTIIPSLAVIVRRLHDLNLSGRWAWLFIIPPLGILLLFYLVKPGQKVKNNFGDVPKN